MSNMKILVTGAAGFIGFHTAKLLLERGDEVVGLDNLNAYYDPKLKASRLAMLEKHGKFRFVRQELAERAGMEAMFAREKFQRVVHLAAQAGVRYSIENPHVYVDSNLTGFLHILEGCRHNGVEHLVYASTSSVYGANTHMPFAVEQNVDHPLTLYAATKKANELMAHSYATLYKIPCTGLRFFTVYGPWGRPDMALFLFTKNILEGKPIDVFNHGHHKRDFTYVGDIAAGVVAAMDHIAKPDPAWNADAPNPAPAARLTACTTSATRSRWSCCATSRYWSSAWARRRRRICCPCSLATCPTPGRMSRRWWPTPATGRAHPSKRV
ncbi:MAG: NAD-dependent epimerase/dehydratase family protein [Steroidobacteraceae bacterium]